MIAAINAALSAVGCTYYLRKRPYANGLARTVVCAYCGRGVTKANPKARYCSPYCRRAAWRERQKSGCHDS
jgi:hypothetical protein